VGCGYGERTAWVAFENPLMRTARVPTVLLDRPFTAVQAAAVGVSRSSLRGAQWRNVFRGVWAHQDLADSREMRFAAVRLVLPDGDFVCGLTAAWLYGIDVQDLRGELIWTGCRTGRRLRTRAGCLVREITVADDDLQVVDGVLMTTPLRTVFDCGRWLSVVEGTVVADAISHSGAVTHEALVAYARTHRALRGVRRLDQVVDLMDPRSESPMETRVRLLIVLSGLPRPHAQLVVVDRAGRFVARADLGYPDHRLIVEYDGAFHWEQRRADDRRRDAMRALGWRVLVVSREDYYDTPGATVEQVRAALDRSPSRA
jgi:Protein of unknown function (DUF559)